MKEKWKKLLICLAVPLSVGGLSAFLTRDGMKTFQTLKKPPLSPPAWVFPLVWTILFLLMGTASFLVLESGKSRRAVRRALTVYGAQLAANFFWPLLFFGLGAWLFSFFWLIFLWILIFAAKVKFSLLSHAAGRLLIPYLAWVAFAGYLNFGVWLLN